MTNKLYRDFTSSEEINAQYDPFIERAREPVVENWFAMSRQTIEELGSPKRISFGKDPTDYIDLYKSHTTSDTEQKAPLHIFIHGGYWRALSTDEFSFVARHLVPAGINIAIINYALCPNVSMHDIVNQVRRATAWIYRQSDRLGFDTEEISLSGHSAGGHLVAMLLATEWKHEYKLPYLRFKTAFAISGVYDLGPFPHSWLQPVLKLNDRDVELLSPTNLQPTENHAKTKLKLYYGKNEPEEFERQSLEYAKQMAMCGYDVTCNGANMSDHFTVLDQFNDKESELTRTVIAAHV